MADEKPSFFTSLPGILSGLAALVTAGVGAFVAYDKFREQRVEPSNAVAAEAAPAKEASLAPPAPAPAEPVQTAPAPRPVAASATAPFGATAVIDDPDGYVNVREGPSTGSRIVAVVRISEPIRTHRQPGAWWRVRTRDGTEGYIHASRIRLIES